MKSLLLSFIVLGALQANAGATVLDQIYPDINGDGLRDKIEISQSEKGVVTANLYLAVEKYDFRLVNQGNFLYSDAELGIAGTLPQVTVNNKNQIIFDQILGSADKLFLTYTFEFMNNDLYLVGETIEDVYFGDGTLTTYNYVEKNSTVQQVKEGNLVSKKKKSVIPVNQLLSLSEVQKMSLDGDSQESESSEEQQ